MSEDLESLYDILRPLSSQTECQDCALCEEHVGLVYLVGSESKGHRLPIVMTSNAAQYLGRTHEGLCAAFDDEKGLCRIYDKRPLCCRLYPLDLMKLEGRIWWVIHAECPIAQRFRREHKLEILAAMTVAMEQGITRDQLGSWLINDKMSQNIEAFSSTEPTVLKLRPFGHKSNF